MQAHVHMHIYMYIHIYVYTCVYVHLYVHLYVYMCATYLYIYICIHTCVYVWICIYIYMYLTNHLLIDRSVYLSIYLSLYLYICKYIYSSMKVISELTPEMPITHPPCSWPLPCGVQNQPNALMGRCVYHRFSKYGTAPELKSPHSWKSSNPCTPALCYVPRFVF